MSCSSWKQLSSVWLLVAVGTHLFSFLLEHLKPLSMGSSQSFHFILSIPERQQACWHGPPPRGRMRSAERGQKAAATLLPAEEEASGLSPPLRERLHGLLRSFSLPLRVSVQCDHQEASSAETVVTLFHTIGLIWNMRSLGFWMFFSRTKFAKLVLFSFLSFTIIKIDFSNGMWWNKCDPDEELILIQYSNILFNVLWSTNDFKTHSLHVASEELCVVVCSYLQFQGRSWDISRRGRSVAARLSPPLAPEELTEALTLQASRGRRGWRPAQRMRPTGALSAKGGILWLKENVSSVWVSLSPSLEVITPFLLTFYAFTTSFKGCVTSLKWYLIFIRRNYLQGELSFPYANRLLIVVIE